MQLIIQIILQFFFLTIDHLLCFRKGGRVSLGCVVDTGLCGDYHSVKWYKDGARLGVLSHGFRCEHFKTSDYETFYCRQIETILEDRLKLGVTNQTNEMTGVPGLITASLEIASVELEDEGLYKCEVTYLDLLSPLCRVVQLSRLTTSAPATSLAILQRPQRGQDTVEVTHGYIPAINQGSPLVLVCQVHDPKTFKIINS